MASMVAEACSSTSQLLPAITVQEKGSRNKRKYRAELPLPDPNKFIFPPPNDCTSYDLSVEKFEFIPSHVQSIGCGSTIHDHSDDFKLDLGFSCSVASSNEAKRRPREESTDVFRDADWSDLTESHLEELVLSNLHTIFKSAIKKIVACGYSEDNATKAVLRSGCCYGCKDSVSNIVDNTLAFLRNGQEISPSRDHYFEDLQVMEKYILAELLCVLREVRPSFSAGDAMWCLLLCDMNVSHACAMDSDCLNGLVSKGASITTHPQLRTDTKSSELNAPHACKPTPFVACSHGRPPSMASILCASSSQSKAPAVAGVPNIKPKTSFVLNGLPPKKECSNSISGSVDKSFSMVGTSQSISPEEKLGASRKASGVTKREYVLRQKPHQLEKHYRSYGSKGPRSGKISSFGSLSLDKKLKSVVDSTGVNVTNASFKISNAMRADTSQDDMNPNLSTNAVVPSSSAFSVDVVNPISTLPKTDTQSTLPKDKTPVVLSAADTELSLSLPAKSNPAPLPVSFNAEAPNCSYAGIPPYGKSLGWGAREKKKEMILKLVPRMQELQNQLQEWTEWANQKVMQAARRLSKDKAELKTLRQEIEEVERLKKEKQTLEENTMKKLSEMENALCKAGGQVDRANSVVHRLEAENAALRQELEAAKLQAEESAMSCQDVTKREKKTHMKFQSWDKQKALFLEEIAAEKRKLGQLQQELKQAKDLQDQLEARWKQEERTKGELLAQASSLRKEREQIEASANLMEDMTKQKAESNLQKYKNDIEKLEKQISQLRSKTDSSKIASLKRGIDGSYADRLTDSRNSQTLALEESHVAYVFRMLEDLCNYSESGGVKRERECVMCLSEEMSVVFLPCAHQVVCKACNELHEKQGMNECPSCRNPIQRRINVRWAPA